MKQTKFRWKKRIFTPKLQPKAMDSAYSTTYPLFCGTLRISADERGITAISFVNKGETEPPQPAPASVEPHLCAAREWLDAYQSARADGLNGAGTALPQVALHIEGTPFQRVVWEEAMKIPFGETVTYGELAQRVARRLGKARMSAQAVGGALRRNKIVLLIPCHRVTAANGQLGGYMGTTGLALKSLLLTHEGRTR